MYVYTYILLHTYLPFSAGLYLVFLLFLLVLIDFLSFLLLSMSACHVSMGTTGGYEPPDVGDSGSLGITASALNC